MGTDKEFTQAAEEPTEALSPLADVPAENGESQKRIPPGRYLETVKGRVTWPRNRTKNVAIPIFRVSNKL